MQRLAATEDGGHGLVGHPDDVVLRLLGGEGRAGRLRVEAQRERADVFRIVALLHQDGPQLARGAKLRHLFDEVVVGVEEE